MNEEKATKTIYKTFGVMGLILAVVAVAISMVSFFGMFAIVPSIISISFCLVSIFSLKKDNKSAKFLLQKAGLLIGSVGLVMSGYQFYQHGQILMIGGMVNHALQETVKETIKEEVKNKIKEKIIPSSTDAPLPDTETNAIEVPVSEPEINSVETTVTSQDFFFITIDRLRIRSTSDLNGETLGHLDFGTRVVDLKEKSDHKDKITLNGDEWNKHWQKISYRQDDYSDPIIGWIYGGGALKPSDDYYEINDGKFMKTINGVSPQELTKMLGIEIGGAAKFIGMITYDSWIKKNGKFYLKGIVEPPEVLGDLAGYRESIYYKGIFKYDKLDGLFEIKDIGAEIDDHIKIQYKNGNCVWFSMVRNEEGDEYINEESNPQDCSLSYISRGLKPK